MSNIQTILESVKPYYNLMEKNTELVTKWEGTGLLEGISDRQYAKHRMAVILENQAKQLVAEASQTGTGGTFTAGTGEQWAGVALPLVRKVFGEISSKEFVSVQPLSLPSGLVFYLEFKYGTQQPTIGGTSDSRFDVGDSLYGTTNQKNVDANGGLYGAGRWGYSVNEATAAVLTASVAYSTASYADVNFNSAYSSSVAAGLLRKVTINSASVNLPGLDTQGVRAFVVSGSGISESTVLSEFTTYNTVGVGSGQVNFIVSGALVYASAQTLNVYYSKQPQDNSRGDFEDRVTSPLTGSAAIPEVDIELRSEPITAKTRKLKAKWTPEFAQDLNAYQSLDAESELTSILSEYIAIEIDAEIFEMLIHNANTVENWSARNNVVINDAQSAFVASASGFYNTQGAWFATLGTKIQKVSNKIHQKTMRGGANVLMCSPDVSTILESMAGYAADTNGDKFEYAAGTQKVGTLNSRWKVFKNPYLRENTILIAYKGTQFLETGAVYAPYIPLIMTPVIYNPDTFTPSKGLLTRYAKKMIRPEFFGKINVEGVETL